jgi:hypothetical protein
VTDGLKADEVGEEVQVHRLCLAKTPAPPCPSPKLHPRLSDEISPFTVVTKTVNFSRHRQAISAYIPQIGSWRGAVEFSGPTSCSGRRNLTCENRRTGRRNVTLSG